MKMTKLSFSIMKILLFYLTILSNGKILCFIQIPYLYLLFFNLESLVQAIAQCSQNLINFTTFQNLSIDDVHHSSSNDINDGEWVISNSILPSKSLVFTLSQVKLICQSTQKTYFMLNNFNQENIYYSIQDTAKSGVKQLRINAQVWKKVQFDQKDKLVIEVFQGKIKQPLSSQQFYTYTIQKQNSYIKCSAGQEFYTYAFKGVVEIQQGQFFIRFSYQKDQTRGPLINEAIEFGIQSLVVQQEFATDPSYGTCTDQGSLECDPQKKLGLSYDPVLKLCIASQQLTFPLCLQQNYYFNLQDKTCLQSCDLSYTSSFVHNSQNFCSQSFNLCNFNILQNCSECDQSSTQCFQCFVGFNLSSNQCLANSQRNCPQQQYFDNYLNSCINCSDKISNCNTCSSDTLCILCDDGYFISPNVNSTNQCNACGQGCNNCVDQNICQQCLAGYTLSSSDSKCYEICTSGQYLDGQICKQCIQGCDQCSNGVKCKVCLNGYFLKDGVCLQSCPQSYYENVTQNKCESCSANCLSCINSQQCLQCDSYNYYIIQNSKCVLQYPSSTTKNGFTIKTNDSVYSDTQPIITLDFDYDLLDRDAKCDIIQKCLSFKIDKFDENTDYTISCEITSKSQVQILFTMKKQIKNKAISIYIEDDAFAGRNNFIGSNRLQVSNFPNYVPLQDEDLQNTKGVKSVGNAVSTSIVSSVIPIIIFSNFSILFNAFDLFQMIFYLKYVNIRHPYNVIQFLDIFIQFQFPFIPNINDIFQQSTESKAPSKFKQQGVSCDFLANAGQDITQFLILLGLYIILKFVSLPCVNPFPKIRIYVAQKIQQRWEFGWFLDCLWEAYLGIVFACVLSLYELFHYAQKETFKLVNYFLSILLIMIVSIIPKVIISLLYYNQNKLHDEHFKEKWEVLYERIEIEQNSQPSSPKSQQYEKQFQTNKFERNNSNQLKKLNNLKVQQPSKVFQRRKMSNQLIKQTTKQTNPMILSQMTDDQIENVNSQSILKRSQSNQYTSFSSYLKGLKEKFKKYRKYFYAILYIRKLLFGIFIVAIHSNPLIQLLLLDALNFTILFLTLIMEPFSTNLENYKSIICEILIIFAHIILKALISDPDDQPEYHRIKIGWIFVSFCILVLFIQFIFLVYLFMKPLVIRIKNRCLKKPQKIHIINQQKTILIVPTQTQTQQEQTLQNRKTSFSKPYNSKIKLMREKNKEQIQSFNSFKKEQSLYQNRSTILELSQEQPLNRLRKISYNMTSTEQEIEDYSFIQPDNEKQPIQQDQLGLKDQAQYQQNTNQEESIKSVEDTAEQKQSKLTILRQMIKDMINIKQDVSDLKLDEIHQEKKSFELIDGQEEQNIDQQQPQNVLTQQIHYQPQEIEQDYQIEVIKEEK